MEPAFGFGGVAQRVVEADRLDMRIALERPGQADGGVLPSRKKDEGAARVGHRTMMPAVRGAGRCEPLRSVASVTRGRGCPRRCGLAEV